MNITRLLMIGGGLVAVYLIWKKSQEKVAVTEILDATNMTASIKGMSL